MTVAMGSFALFIPIFHVKLEESDQAFLQTVQFFDLKIDLKVQGLKIETIPEKLWTHPCISILIEIRDINGANLFEAYLYSHLDADNFLVREEFNLGFNSILNLKLVKYPV